MKNSRASGKSNLGVFHVSCWVMGLVAFVQLMSVGVALAMRGHVREVKTEVKTEYVMIPSPTTAPVKVEVPVVPERDSVEETIAVREPVAEEIDIPSVEPDEKAVSKIDRKKILNSAPPILDPVVEALVNDAREARVRGDLVLSLAKLQEAETTDPDNPNVIYGLAKNYEDFGIWDTATVHYMKIYKMGPMKAGSLFEKAALKVAVGLKPDVKDLAMIGWSRMSAPQRQRGGERRTLLLPVTVTPGREFDPNLLQPQVRFYEDIDGKISQAIIKEGHSGSDWVTGTADWQDGEEMAEVWYFVPDQDRASGFLFGKRDFYGFVAELYYDGRLVDIRAFPRTLLQEARSQPGVEDYLDELDGLDLDDFGAGDTLLPNMGNSPDSSPADFGIPAGVPFVPGEDEGLSVEDE